MKKKKKPTDALEIEVIPADEWHSDADDFEIDAAKEEAWAKRDWRKWAMENLTFPLNAERVDGDDQELFGFGDPDETVMVGERVKVVGLDEEEGRWGLQARVQCGKRRLSVPLADLSVRPKSNKNFQVVLEYSVAVGGDYIDLGYG
ncbi:MAG: hypothetical protein HYY24_02550 [Verrucomicrobia bacterium]|nr:hypothetical protein [Verrucomicrobiota bacterium]